MTNPKRAKEMMTGNPILIDIDHVEGVCKLALKEEYQLADAHWEWLGPTLEKMFKDAFVHGYKHGREAK